MKVCILEKEADVCCGNSGRNTGMLHAGFLYKPGTNKARFSVEGNLGFDKVAEELDIPFKLTIGFAEKQREKMLELKEQGEKNGVPGLSIIDRDEIRRIEPNGSGEFTLFSPTSGIFCPYIYTIALAENAKMNGTDFFFEHEVTGVKNMKDGTYVLTIPEGKFSSRWVINSCGLNAPAVAAMLGSPGHVYGMAKGEYILLDKRAGEYLHVPVYPVVDDNSVLGIYATPTVDGNVLIGPNHEIVETPEFDTTQVVFGILAKAGFELFEKMKPEWYIRGFAGIRPRLIDPKTGADLDLLIEHKEETPTIINLVGMNSPLSDNQCMRLWQRCDCDKEYRTG